MQETYDMPMSSEQYVQETLAGRFELVQSGLTSDEIAASLGGSIKELHGNGVEVVSLIGGAASGKSTFARSIVDDLAQSGLTADVVGTDDFNKGDRTWRWEHFEGKEDVDPRGKYDFGLLNKKIRAIKQNADPSAVVPVPTYNQATGLAIDEGEENYQHKVGKVDVLIVEGDFHPVEEPDLVVYLNVPDDQRLQNRVNRDVVHRGGDPQKTTDSFNFRHRVQHLPHTLPTIQEADIVVDVDASNDEWRFNVYRAKVANDAEQDSIESRMPFRERKIPVSKGLAEFNNFVEQYPDFYICPYIADKTDEGWDSSTSRSYMNQVLPGFLYVPVNVPKDDTQGLDELLMAIKDNKRVAAVNITQPHKSSPTIRRIFIGDEISQQNVDTLIRNVEGELEPYDLNAPAFVGWYKDEVGEFADSTVVLVGVGGVGEPMAKAIAKEAPAHLILIDPNNKQHLVTQLQAQVTDTRYYGSVAEVPNDGLGDSLVLINAAGKEGANDNSGVSEIINRMAHHSGVFVDIRPQLDIDIVETARSLGWRAYTGNGMNARNDYTLLSGIASYSGLTPPSFDEFDKLVAAAS